MRFCLVLALYVAVEYEHTRIILVPEFITWINYPSTTIKPSL